MGLSRSIPRAPTQALRPPQNACGGAAGRLLRRPARSRGDALAARRLDAASAPAALPGGGGLASLPRGEQEGKIDVHTASGKEVPEAATINITA